MRHVREAVRMRLMALALGSAVVVPLLLHQPSEPEWQGSGDLGLFVGCVATGFPLSESDWRSGIAVFAWRCPAHGDRGARTVADLP